MILFVSLMSLSGSSFDAEKVNEETALIKKSDLELFVKLLKLYHVHTNLIYQQSNNIKNLELQLSLFQKIEKETKKQRIKKTIRNNVITFLGSFVVGFGTGIRLDIF